MKSDPKPQNQFPSILIILPSLTFFVFFVAITQNNFYLWDSFLLLNQFLNAFPKKFIFFDTSNSTLLYNLLYFYLFKILGVQNPSTWFIITAFWHILNAFLLLKIAQSFFSPFQSTLQSSIPHILQNLILSLIIMLFLFFSVFHENLFYSFATDKHLISTTFILTSFLFYLKFFDPQSSYSKKIPTLAFSAFFSMLSMLISQQAFFLIPSYFLLDFLIFNRKTHLSNSSPHLPKKIKYLLLFLTLPFLTLISFYASSLSQIQNIFVSRDIYSSDLTHFHQLFYIIIHSFFELFIPFFTSLNIPFKILSISCFIISYPIIFFSLNSQLKKIFLFSITCSILSLLPFFFGELDLQNYKLPSRYLYISSFWFLLSLFTLAVHFVLRFKVIVISLLFFLAIAHSLGLFIANQIIYIPTSQAHKSLVKLNQVRPYSENFPISYSFLKIHKKRFIKNYYSHYIFEYIKKSKNLPSKYHLPIN